MFRCTQAQVCCVHHGRVVAQVDFCAGFAFIVRCVIEPGAGEWHPWWTLVLGRGAGSFNGYDRRLQVDVLQQWPSLLQQLLAFERPCGGCRLGRSTADAFRWA